MIVVGGTFADRFVKMTWVIFRKVLYVLLNNHLAFWAISSFQFDLLPGSFW